MSPSGVRATVARRIGRLIGRVNLPVLAQEMRIRQRGSKPFVVMCIYVLALSGLALFVLSIATRGRPYLRSSDLAEMGQGLFLALMCAQLALIALIVPAYSAGVVTGERERATFELLALTLLSSSGIVAQKLAAALAQAVMLIVASLPVVSIVFLLGGVSPFEVVAAYLLLVLTAGMIGAFGVLCSCQFRSTRGSTFAAYLGVLTYLAGVPLFGQWMIGLSGLSINDSAFSFTVAGTFAFVCGVMALFVYATAALVLRRRVKWWRSRAARMVVFGATYAATMLVMSTPKSADAIIGMWYVYHQEIFLPLLVNPFLAMTQLIYRDSPPAGPYGVRSLSLIATPIFALLCIYLFKQMSTFRFEALRRV